LLPVIAFGFADYSKLRGSSFSPVWGPSDALRERLQGGEAVDVFASAALPHAEASPLRASPDPAYCLRATPCVS
jgi:ABC-type molybdate transport system substrate-binding protein